MAVTAVRALEKAPDRDLELASLRRASSADVERWPRTVARLKSGAGLQRTSVLSMTGTTETSRVLMRDETAGQRSD